MPSHPVPPAEEQLLEKDSFAFDLVWARYRSLILLLVAAVVVAGVATVLWLINSHNARLAAESLFAEANSPEAWQKVLASHPHSPQAADACLLLAEAQREAGDPAASTETFHSFLVKFPDHRLSGAARLGIAENLDVEGKSAEAVTALSQIQASEGGSYVAAFAALLEGRIALREGRLADARTLFSSLVATYTSSPVAQMAGAQLEELLPFLPLESEKPAP